MYKRKVKLPGGAKRASGDQQQGDGAELDDEWQVVPEEELQALANVRVEIVHFGILSKCTCFNVYLGAINLIWCIIHRLEVTVILKH